MSKPDNTATKEIDLCELSCPHRLINVIAAIRSLEAGQKLQIRATDLNAPSSISAWSRQSGNQLLDIYQEGNCFVFLLKRNSKDVAHFDKKRVTPAKKEEGSTLAAKY